MLSQMPGQDLYNRCQVEVQVRKVERQNAGWFKVTEVKLHGLFCEKMHRDSISVEGINNEKVVVLSRLVFEREPAITQDNLNFATAVG